MNERIAIIDLGSNSIRLVIFQIYENGAYNLIHRKKENGRLSGGMIEGEKLVLTRAAMERTIESLKGFSYICKFFNVDQIIAVATAAVRESENGEYFIKLAEEETGIKFKILSGEEEAVLGCVGAINTLDVNDAVFLDIGGASTEITYIKDRKIHSSASFPFGAVVLTEMFNTADEIPEESLRAMHNYVASYLDKIPWMKDLNVPIVGIGGTARSLTRIDQKLKKYPFPKIHNYRFGNMAFNKIYSMLTGVNLKERKKVPGLNSDRADIITAGAIAIKEISDTVKSTNFIVSDCGLREGLFFNYYFNLRQEDQVISDILMHSVYNVLLFYNASISHAECVTNSAVEMFDSWQELHKMSDRSRELLKVASLLHDVGISINYFNHAKHSAYIIENARLLGLTHREQMLTAMITNWHDNYQTKGTRFKIYNEFLDDVDWEIARKTSTFLSLAESVQSVPAKTPKTVKAKIKGDTAYLTIQCPDFRNNDLEAVRKEAKRFEKEFGLKLIIEKQ